MLYAKIENGEVIQYPYSDSDLRTDYPATSFATHIADETLEAFGVVRVVVTGAPAFDPATEQLIDVTPVFSDERQRWETAWEVVPVS